MRRKAYRQFDRNSLLCSARAQGGKHEPIINALVCRATLGKPELLETIYVLPPSPGQRKALLRALFLP